MKYLLIVALALLPTTAFATSFVYDGGPIGSFPDGGALVFPKLTNAPQTGIPANKQLYSDDANALWRASLDLRSALTVGYYHGLAQISSVPPAPTTGFIEFNLNGVFTFEDSLGNVWQLSAYWNDAGAGTIFASAVAVANGLHSTSTLIVDENSTFGDQATFENGILVSSGPSILDNLYVKGAVILDGGESISHGGITFADGSLQTTAAKTYWDDAGSNGAIVNTNSGPVRIGTTSNLGGASLQIQGTGASHNVYQQWSDGTNSYELKGSGTSLEIISDTDIAIDISPNNTGSFQFRAAGASFFAPLSMSATKITSLAPGTAGTDAVDLNQLIGVYSLSAYAPAGVAVGTKLATLRTGAAGTARAIGAARQASSASCVGDPCSGWVTYEVYDSTAAASVCSISIPGCCFESAGGSCPAFLATSPVTTCSGSWSATNILQMDVSDAGACTGLPSVMLNFRGY